MKINEHLKKIQTYKPGKPIAELKRELKLEEIVKLASNENPLGPSPLAMQAMRDAIPTLNRYPEGDCPLLKQALAAKLEVGENQLIIGNGSNEILIFLAQACLGHGDEAVMAVPGFPVYKIATQMMAAVPVEVPLKNGVHDLEAMGCRITDKTRLLFLCNPNNPTGTSISDDALRGLLATARDKNVLVVIDEAYYEYVCDKAYPDSLALLKTNENLVVTRSFSKIYGLAGLRVGYAIGPPSIVEALEKVRQPFNVNSLAQCAALAALTDDEHLEKSIQLNREGIEYLAAELIALGYQPLPSQANFIYFPLNAAQAFCRDLLSQGLILRPIGDTAARITIGLPEENERLVKTLKTKKERG